MTSASLNVEQLSNEFMMFDISIRTINEYLRDSWLSVASTAGGLFGETLPRDLLSLCVAEVKSSWLPDFDDDFGHFSIKFAPPEARALCAKEIVLFLNIDEIVFYDDLERFERQNVCWSFLV
jgi:hypothetical protein